MLCLAPLAGAAPGALAAPAPCDNADVMPTTDNLQRVGASVSCLVNAERSDHGIRPLNASAQLRAAAQGMSDLMVEQSFFSHETPDGRALADRVRPIGYLPRSDAWLLGEDLAWGSGSLSTPRAIVQGWMNSPGHRANILAADYEDLGVGVTLGSPRADWQGGATYATDFGTRNTRPSVKVPARVSADRDRAGSDGISYSATCSRPCTLIARLFFDRATATSAGAGSSRRVLLATGRLRLQRAGTGTLTVRLRPDAEEPLRGLDRPTLALVTEAAGTPVARRTRVTLR